MISCKGSKQTRRIHADSRCSTLQFQYCLSQKHSRRLSPGNFYGELETIWPPASRSDLSNSQPRLEDQNEAESIFLRLSFRSHIPVFCQIWIFIQVYNFKHIYVILQIFWTFLLIPVDSSADYQLK